MKSDVLVCGNSTCRCLLESGGILYALFIKKKSSLHVEVNSFLYYSFTLFSIASIQCFAVRKRPCSV